MVFARVITCTSRYRSCWVRRRARRLRFGHTTPSIYMKSVYLRFFHACSNLLSYCMLFARVITCLYGCWPRAASLCGAGLTNYNATLFQSQSSDRFHLFHLHTGTCACTGAGKELQADTGHADGGRRWAQAIELSVSIL
jgi:hypothetical protein